MTKTLYGERIGREGKIRLGCSAVIFDEQREKALLTRRADNGEWCLPGGGVDAGESVAEACLREIWEETGLRAEIVRLVGVYSDPNRLVVYPDGNKAHIVALHFEARIVAGEPGLSNETTDWGYFSLEEAAELTMLSNHLTRMRDSLDARAPAIIC